MPLDKRDWIAGLEHGLRVIEAFDRDHDRMTIAAVAARTGLTRSAARRYLLTLAHLGYVHFDGKLFSLAPRVLRVGWSYFDSARLPRLLQPYLQRLSSDIGESCFVSVLDDWHLVVVARSGGTRVTSTGYVLGARVPAVLTSAGIVLLATQQESPAIAQWLDEHELVQFTPHTMIDKTALLARIALSREQGNAVIEQQLQLEVRGISVPLRRWDGEVVAALSVSLPMKGESTENAVRRVLPALEAFAYAVIDVI